jgi:hypothetical protein
MGTIAPVGAITEGNRGFVVTLVLGKTPIFSARR